MPDVFTKAKRSEVMSRIRGRGNKDTEIALAQLPEALQVCEMAAAERDGQQSAFAKKRTSADRSRLLAAQAFCKQEARPNGEPDFAQGRVACDSDLGA
jgi:hypothetical protein